MDIMSIFGERFEELIFENRYTPDSLSKVVKIDSSVIRRYIRKECVLTLGNAIVIADCFSCSLDFLFGLSDVGEISKYLKAPPFSESLNRILKDREYSRYRLCKEGRFSDQSVDDWFHGKRLPTVENAIKLAEFFDCSLDFLVGRE